MAPELESVTGKPWSCNGPLGATDTKRAPQSNLCARCTELRLDDALKDLNPPLESSKPFDIKIAVVGQYYRDQQARDCDLCNMLSASRVTVDQLGGYSDDREDVDELHVYELWQDLSWLRPSSRLDMLRGEGPLYYLLLVPSGFNRDRFSKHLELHGERKGFNVIRRQGTSQPRMYSPQIIGTHFDLIQANYWLQYCKDHHKRLCSKTSKRTIDLHLIDCRSLEVVPSPYQAEYTALSYVWGVPAKEANSSGSPVRPGCRASSSILPLTPLIADAIYVTVTLGFRYLWVDRYCINQDSHSKHQQINQMDSIYQNAELTIVAASGSGPQHSLPGIFSPRQRRQRRCTVGDFDIIQTMQHPHSAIRSSRWASRGWTFQEAALSRRNLVITDDQVYFECNAMNCHESLTSDLDKLHVIGKSKFRDVLQAGLFGRTEKQKYGHFDDSALQGSQNLVGFMGMVEQYTARDLTYDSDSLNAFTGIMRKFENMTGPKLGNLRTAVNQIWGVPFTSLPDDERWTELSFLDGLAWNHKPSADDGDLGRPRRRREFPSWSWAGWAGEIQYQGRVFDGMPRSLLSNPSMKVHVSVENSNGLVVDLAAYMNERGLSDTTSPPMIHIQAPVLPASAFSCDILTIPPKLRVFQHPTTLALSVGPWDVKDFCQSLVNTNRRKCIYIGQFQFRLNFVMLMVLEARSGSWSRVGMVFVDDVWYSHFRSSWDEFNLRSRGRGQEPLTQGIGDQVMSFRLI